jgi:hypothetical protein
MAAEIKNLDTDLQMLVYENYNKFISATDTIKRMKSNIFGMEGNMDQLLQKIMSVQSKSDGVNTSLFEKREHIEKLHRTRNLLRKVQVCNESFLLAYISAVLSPDHYSNNMNLLKLIFVRKSSSSMIYLQDCKNVSSQKPMAMLSGSILEQCQFSRYMAIHHSKTAGELPKKL